MRRAFQFIRRSARHIRADVADELAFHLDARTEALIAEGLDPGRARAQAVREFGDPEQAHREITAIDRRTETARRRKDYTGDLGQDIIYALRQLRAAPGFTLTAIATLAIGIGVNTAIFSVVSSVLLRALPFAQPDRLVQVWSANRTADRLHASVSPLDVDDWRAQRWAVTDLGGYWFQADGGSGVDYTGAGEPRRLGTAFVTPGFFSTLGVPPLVGRLPREDEMVRGGADHVVVLSHRFWMQHFGGQRSAIGTTMTLDTQPYEVLGIMPPSFRYPANVEIYVPYSSIPDASIPRIRQVRVLSVVARLGVGQSIEQARTELSTVAARLAQEYRPNRNYDAVTVEPLRDAITGQVRTALWVLQAAVAFVLLMACANVAGLLIARGTVRTRELGLRAALGAGRGRIVRQLLTESMMLALVGGIIGLSVAGAGVQVLRTLAADQLPSTAAVRLDATALLFTLGLSLITGLLFGMAPALRAAAVDLAQVLRSAGRGTADGMSQRLRNALVVAEVALAVVLVVGGGLMARSLIALMRVDPGFDPENLVAVNFTISTDRHPADYRLFYHQVIDRVRALPGVLAAGAVKDAPFRGAGEQQSFVPEGFEVAPGDDAPTAMVLHVSDGYFATIDAVMREGREFTVQDDADAPPVVVVNEALARRYFGTTPVVGRHVIFGRTPVEIVGVVNDIRQTRIAEPARPTIYLNNMQNTRVKTTLVVRTRGDPTAMARQVREAIWALDRSQTITSVFTLDDALSEAQARPRLLAVLLGLFGAMGLLLGALGMYGLLAYLVNQRQREIGVRLALGAEPGQVLAIVVGRGVVLAALGVALGLAGAFGVTRLLRGVLYGVGPDDPLTFAGVAVGLVVVAVLASWSPARRAAAVDPAAALRYD